VSPEASISVPSSDLSHEELASSSSSSSSSESVSVLRGLSHVVVECDINQKAHTVKFYQDLLGFKRIQLNLIAHSLSHERSKVPQDHGHQADQKQQQRHEDEQSDDVWITHYETRKWPFFFCENLKI